MAIDVKAGSSIETGAPIALFQSPFQVDPFGSLWDVASDGKRFLISEPVGEGGKPITVVLN